jgi:hypothetical protein
VTPLEQEILDAVRRIANTYSDNEATDRPVWWILTPRFGGGSNTAAMLSSVLGPFWSREEAQAWLDAKRYRFSAKAKVYCGSAHHNPELRKLFDLSRRMGEEAK